MVTDIVHARAATPRDKKNGAFRRHVPKAAALLVTTGLLAGCPAVPPVGDVMKPVLKQRCADASLQDCEDLTSGVLGLVEGRRDAKLQLDRGVGANSRDRVLEFSDRLLCAEDLVKQIPGAGAATRPAFQALAALRDAALEKPGANTDDAAKKLVFRLGCKTKQGGGASCAIKFAADADDRVTISSPADAAQAKSISLSKEDLLRAARILQAQTGRAG